MENAANHLILSETEQDNVEIPGEGKTGRLLIAGAWRKNLYGYLKYLSFGHTWFGQNNFFMAPQMKYI